MTPFIQEIQLQVPDNKKTYNKQKKLEMKHVKNK